jgi:hypothetical protein
MSLATGQQALISRITSSLGHVNIVLPNGQPTELPRYVIETSTTEQKAADISGAVEATIEIKVRVETQKGEFATENDGMVNDLVDLFRIGDRFDGVTIIEAPVLEPAEMGAIYAVPVTIKGIFAF